MSKWLGVCDEDVEDFEQEKLISEWLKREGSLDQIELKYISNKGTARNTLIKAAFSLDEKVSDDDSGGTYADIIVGSDGRDMGDGDPIDEVGGEFEWSEWAIQAITNFATSKETKEWARYCYRSWCEKIMNN